MNEINRNIANFLCDFNTELFLKKLKFSGMRCSFCVVNKSLLKEVTLVLIEEHN